MTTEEKQEEVKINVEETKDGTAVVTGIELDDEQPSEEKAVESSKEETSVKESELELPEDGGEDHPDDTEAIREARRNKRKLKKQLARQAQAEKDLRFQQLQRQNQELLERLQAVEQRTHGSELARLDKAIEDQQVRINYARMKIAEATKHQDGEAMSEAQDLLYEARRSLESLEELKKRSATPQKQNIAPDIAVQRHAAKWMERNNWYDPSGKDEDSEIALLIDKKLAREGFDPRDAEYWEELDERLRKRLPHRYQDSDDETEVVEEKPPMRRPKPIVTGSGKEGVRASGGKNTFTLSAEQVAAMKDAGLWDDPEARARMIRRYAAEARKK